MVRTRILVAALLLLTACGATVPSRGSAVPPSVPLPESSATLPASATAQPTSGAPTSAPTPFDPFATAPSAVAGRDPLPACGLEVVEREVGGDVYDSDARQCFWTAWQERRPAEFVSVPITVEGGRTTDVYRILPDAGVEIFVDWSGDPYGPYPGWVRTQCTALTRYSNAAAPDVIFLEGTGCGPWVELPEG